MRSDVKKLPHPEKQTGNRASSYNIIFRNKGMEQLLEQGRLLG